MFTCLSTRLMVQIPVGLFTLYIHANWQAYTWFPAALSKSCLTAYISLHTRVTKHSEMFDCSNNEHSFAISLIAQTHNEHSCTDNKILYYIPLFTKSHCCTFIPEFNPFSQICRHSKIISTTTDSPSGDNLPRSLIPREHLYTLSETAKIYS